MWGRLVIRPSDTDEVRQESAFLGDESAGDGGEEATTPQYQTFAEEIEKEHTPRTPSTERPGTPPPPNYDCETESATSPRSHTTPDQTEVVERGILERPSAEGQKFLHTR